MVLKTVLICIGCKEKLEREPLGLTGERVHYCKNQKCSRYGLCTAIVDKEEWEFKSEEAHDAEEA